jgi:carbon storage regulator
MLTVKRRERQGLVICHTVVLTVLEVRGGKVRLGIDCPAGCPVQRQEAYEAIPGRQPPAPGRLGDQLTRRRLRGPRAGWSSAAGRTRAW